MKKIAARNVHLACTDPDVPATVRTHAHTPSIAIPKMVHVSVSERKEQTAPKTVNLERTDLTAAGNVTAVTVPVRMNPVII